MVETTEINAPVMETTGIAEMLTAPVTTALTVPVATTIKPVAVAVRPDDAVVNAALSTATVPPVASVTTAVLEIRMLCAAGSETVPLTTADTLRPGTTLTTCVPRMVETTEMSAPVIETTGSAEIDTGPVTTAVTVPVATTTSPVAVAVSPEDAVVNAACETATVPDTCAETDAPC